MIPLKVFRTHSTAVLPKYATKSSACFDLCACITDSVPIKSYAPNNGAGEFCYKKQVLLMPGTRLLLPTGLIFDIPDGYSLRLHPRSGLALKQGITLLNCEGVVDQDYVEETCVIVFNHSEITVVINHGDRICQAELVKFEPVEIVETKERPAQKTDRTGGFGSTGKT